MKKMMKLMRVHHYIKNLLVFAALICSGQFFSAPDKLLAGCIGFVAFSVTSSAIYIINDIREVEKDRKHPTKCRRPIASGAVSVRQAGILAVVLLSVAAVCSFASAKPQAALWLVLYFLLNLVYSFGLKNYPLIDVAILAAGFLIRVLYGAALTGIVVSNWLYLTVMAAALYFSLGKRRNECKQNESGETRAVLRAYSVAYLDKSMNMCLTLLNVFYALWSMDTNTAAHYNSSRLVLTAPLVLLITMKYSLVLEGESDGDPVEVLLHDRVLLGLCLIYAVCMVAILYS